MPKHEDTRFGCKDADQYYAGEFNISEEEASEIYICSEDSRLKGIPECPFIFLSDGCPVAYNKSAKWMQGLVAGLLGDKVKTCKLTPVEIGTRIDHICSDCNGVIRGDITKMKFCYSCGVRIE